MLKSRNRIDDAFALLEEQGDSQYGEEAVSQLQHALQCAALGEAAGAGPALIVAALFHDIGHLTDPEFEAAMGRSEDRWHERLGADYLQAAFGPAVVEPVRMHVPAKRYLCAIDKDYLAGLSPASVKSLAMQGGPFSDSEAAAFIDKLYAPDAVSLRRWDDLAKDPAATPPPLAHFRSYALLPAVSGAG